MTARFQSFPCCAFLRSGGTQGVYLDLGEGPFQASNDGWFGRNLGLEVPMAAPKAASGLLFQRRDRQIAHSHNRPRASKNP